MLLSSLKAGLLWWLRWQRILYPDGKESAHNKGDWVQSLDWEDPLEEGMAIHSSILAWRIPVNREAWQVTVHGVAKSQT